jgi:hypothetical protein
VCHTINVEEEAHVTPQFFTYFVVNWLGEWEQGWHDHGQPGHQEGIFNTNNGVESLTTHYFWRCCVNSIELSVYIWACGVHYTFNVKWQHKIDGVIVEKPLKLTECSLKSDSGTFS